MANPECPWFKFYVRDWLTDARVRAMTYEQRGAYLELLCLQWENGAIPYAVSEIAALLNLSVEHFKAAIWTKLAGRFPRSGGRNSRRRNARLEREREYFARKQSAGKRGGTKSKPPKRLLRSASSKPEATIENRVQMTDEEKNKMKRMSTHVDSRPVPGKGDDFPIISWNMLAERHYLQPIEKLTTARKKALASALREFPDFWERLEVELCKRSNWAKERRFPTFDQATRASTLVKILEGNYRLDFDHKPKTLRQSNILPIDGPATITVDGEEHVIPDPDESF